MSKLELYYDFLLSKVCVAPATGLDIEIPLIEFKDIPFPVTFEKIIMTEKSAIMTGKPKEFKGGKTWHWE